MEPVAPRRIVGLDVARCLALLGMMATHVLPTVESGRVVWAHQLAGGRASVVFAVLAGVTIGLAGGGRRPLAGRAWAGAAVWLLVRAALIGLVGLLLGELETGIAVVLTYYAVLFVLAAPFLSLPARTLAALAAVWAVAGPLLSFLLRPHLPATTYRNPSLGRLDDDPLRVLAEVGFTGYYPAVTWLAFLLVGLAVGRLDLRSVRVAAGLSAVGVALVALGTAVSAALLGRAGVRSALVSGFEGAGWRGSLDLTLDQGLYGVPPLGSWWWLAAASPHTGSPPDVVVATGWALVVLGACLAVARLAPRLLGVAFGAGTMTLTLYSLHVVLRREGWWDGDTAGVLLGQGLLVVAIGAAYRAAGRPGPLEHLVSDLSRAARSVVAGRTRHAARR